MRKELFFASSFIVVFFWACQSQSSKEAAPAVDTVVAKMKVGTGPDPRFYVTKKSFGLVKLTDTYDDIVKTYGAERVSEEKAYRAPESEEQVIKTFVNKGRSDEIIIQWDDAAFHKKIIAIQSVQPNSAFKTEEGIQFGTTLGDLVKLNGAKISFNGFAWGFAGMMTDFHKGNLKGNDTDAAIRYEIDLPVKNPEPAILGDQILDTDMPIAKKYLNDIIVYKIILYPGL
jgi:hypothetical protein